MARARSGRGYLSASVQGLECGVESERLVGGCRICCSRCGGVTIRTRARIMLPVIMATGGGTSVTTCTVTLSAGDSVWLWLCVCVCIWLCVQCPCLSSSDQVVGGNYITGLSSVLSYRVSHVLPRVVGPASCRICWGGKTRKGGNGRGTAHDH